MEETKTAELITPKSVATENEKQYTSLGQVNGTPFNLGKWGDEIIILIGNQRISEKAYKSEKAAKAYIAGKPWELLINTICYIADMISKQNNEPLTKND